MKQPRENLLDKKGQRLETASKTKWTNQHKTVKGKTQMNKNEDTNTLTIRGKTNKNKMKQPKQNKWDPWGTTGKNKKQK